MSHPLGVQPEGNLLLAPDFQSRELGRLGCVSESILGDIVAWLDGDDLARFSAASSACYVFGQLEEPWKALVLTKWKGSVLPGGPSPTWQTAFISESLRAVGKSPPPPRGEPVRVRGFYSDLIFKAGLCASAPIDPAWLTRENLPRRSAATLSVAEFVEQFERPNKPLIITDAMADWRATRDWTIEALARDHGDASFHAGGYDVRESSGIE